jgi:hypothetical protein
VTLTRAISFFCTPVSLHLILIQFSVIFLVTLTKAILFPLFLACLSYLRPLSWPGCSLSHSRIGSLAVFVSSPESHCLPHLSSQGSAMSDWFPYLHAMLRA